jgi:hypothetical protein
MHILPKTVKKSAIGYIGGKIEALALARVASNVLPDKGLTG